MPSYVARCPRHPDKEQALVFVLEHVLALGTPVRWYCEHCGLRHMMTFAPPLPSAEERAQAELERQVRRERRGRVRRAAKRVAHARAH